MNTKYFRALVLSLVFFIPSVSSAQKFGYGIKGGLSISEISKLTYETNSKTGFSVYAFGDYYLSNIFLVDAQVGYIQKGFTTKSIDYYTYEDVHYYGPIKANLNYVDISVLGKFIFKGKVSPYIMAGPALGIKVGANATTSGNRDDSRYEIQYLLDQIYKNSFGIKTGLGVEISLIKRMSFILETVYNYDLISSYDAPDFRVGIETWYYADDVRNSVLEFLVGVKF